MAAALMEEINWRKAPDLKDPACVTEDPCHRRPCTSVRGHRTCTSDSEAKNELTGTRGSL